MATKGKESRSPKERSITSPPCAPKSTTSQQRKNPSTSGHVSSVKSHDLTVTEKHIPNYLKPTISSGLDLSIHQLKKNTLSDSKISRRKSFDKPLLPSLEQKMHTSPSDSKNLRRKSFDKPLLSSLVHKTRTSPSPKERTMQSSSFTTRSTNSQKSFPERLLKSSMDVGEGQNLYGRPSTVKKTNTNIKKQEKAGSVTKRQIASTNSNVDGSTIIDVIVKLKPDQGDPDTSIIQVDEEVLNVKRDSEMATEVSAMEDYCSTNLPKYVGILEVEDVTVVDYPVKCQDESIISQVEKHEEILEVGKSSEGHSILKEHTNVDNDESVRSEAKVEDEEMEKLKPKEDHRRPETGKMEEGHAGLTEDAQLQETKNTKDDADETTEKIKTGIRKMEEGHAGLTEDVQLQEKENAKDDADETTEEVKSGIDKMEEGHEGSTEDAQLQERENAKDDVEETTEEVKTGIGKMEEGHEGSAENAQLQESENAKDDVEETEVKTGVGKIEEGHEGSTEDAQLQESENAKNDADETTKEFKTEETKQQVIHGKLDGTLSNDVIEETATKLREQKKNKVKALAGAFETVISLQESK